MEKPELPQPPSYATDIVPSTYIRPAERKLHDPDVTFEEYHYYALRTREEQAKLEVEKTTWREIVLRKKPTQQLRQSDDTDNRDVSPYGSDEHGMHGQGAEAEKGHRDSVNLSRRQDRMVISDKEWVDAQRALRTATWGAVFYLIVCDVIGPYGTPFAIGTLGYGPGVALYVVFGLTAGYSGYLIHRTFLGLDSYEFPLKNYGDLAFRTWGSTFRLIVNLIQTLSLLLIMGQVTIQNGMALSQVSKFRLCYAVCNVVFIAVGFLLGQIRTLKNYGWVANLAIWVNLLVIFISMGVIAHSPPNFLISKLGSVGNAVNPDSVTPNANGVYPPIQHSAGLPSNGLVGSINGLMSGVLAYAGAQLYAEFLSEMRRPADFIRSLFMAMCFIITVYLVYGCFVYYYQGQYTYSVSYQGVSVYAWQVVGDMLGVISGLIAAGLYGNIGVKVLYNNFLMDYLNAPPLNSTPGKIYWALLVPLFWSIAFVIAAAIPDYFAFVSVMSAATLLPLTYAFPPIMAIGYDIQFNAMKADASNGFDPSTGRTARQWTGIRRWTRGYFAGGLVQVCFNLWHTVYALGALSLVGLGMYASIQALREAYSIPQFNAFTCTSPLNLNG